MYNVCARRFTVKGDLTEHMRKHSKKRPYSCKTCDKDFKYPNWLSMHMRTHTKDRPYGCEICCQRFSQKSYLKYHSKIHTGDVGRKRFALSTSRKSLTIVLKIIRMMRKNIVVKYAVDVLTFQSN